VHFCNEVSLRTCSIRHKWDVGEDWKVCHILVQVFFCERKKEVEILHPKNGFRMTAFGMGANEADGRIARKSARAKSTEEARLYFRKLFPVRHRAF
jgi:hypothetical protein